MMIGAVSRGITTDFVPITARLLRLRRCPRRPHYYRAVPSISSLSICTQARSLISRWRTHTGTMNLITW